MTLNNINSLSVCFFLGAKKRSNPFFLCAARWIASRSLSSGARSRDPLARNDGFRISLHKGRGDAEPLAQNGACNAHASQPRPSHPPASHAARLTAPPIPPGG